MNIKKLLLGTVASVAVFAGPALAADMPVKAPPPALAPVAPGQAGTLASPAAMDGAIRASIPLEPQPPATP
jgi:hypothetical protein